MVRCPAYLAICVLALGRVSGGLMQLDCIATRGRLPRGQRNAGLTRIVFPDLMPSRSIAFPDLMQSSCIYATGSSRLAKADGGEGAPRYA